MRKTAFFLLIGIFLTLKAEATMVSFIVVETGLPHEGARSLHSERWENVLMDVFFEEGYIVSNAPVLRLESKPSGKIGDMLTNDFDNAREGGADYIVIVQLDYEQEISAPEIISIFLYRIYQYVNIYEQQITGKTYRTARDEIDEIRVIIRGLVSHLRTQ